MLTRYWVFMNLKRDQFYLYSVFGWLILKMYCGNVFWERTKSTCKFFILYLFLVKKVGEKCQGKKQQQKTKFGNSCKGIRFVHLVMLHVVLFGLEYMLVKVSECQQELYFFSNGWSKAFQILESCWPDISTVWASKAKAIRWMTS